MFKTQNFVCQESFGAQNNLLKTKIFLPPSQGINYVGLIIGPHGLYQKKLEMESGCKILIRGKYIFSLTFRGSHKDSYPA